MQDRERYRQILGIQPPWEVSEVDVNLPGTAMTVKIRHSGTPLTAEQLGLCWSAVSGVPDRAVARCPARREQVHDQHKPVKG